VADIWEHTELAAMKKMADEGHLMQYRITSDAQYPDAHKRSGFFYPFCYAQVVVGWNTDLVRDAEAAKRLKTWEGLLDPYWKGKSIGALIIQSGGTTHVTYYMLQEKYGIDFWKKLAAAEPKMYAGVNPMTDAVASGELALGLFGSEAGFYAKYDRGAPVHWTNPDPRVVVPYGQAIAKEAPHPYAAKLFQEFVFSETGQKIVASTALPSFRVGDLRKHAKEPWYSQPPEYQYDADKIYRSLSGPNNLVDQWNKIFRK
jgi:iron(III) transport system substrate-binding protein